MRSVTYSMNISLDGYIVGPDGSFDWSEPDPEVFGSWLDEIRQVDVHLLGRRLYETMLYWETAEQEHTLDEAELEWAALWKALPKVVFSTTLSAVQGNARLLSGGGVPFFPWGERRVDLEPVETRTFDSGVIYLRYRVLS